MAANTTPLNNETETVSTNQNSNEISSVDNSKDNVQEIEKQQPQQINIVTDEDENLDFYQISKFTFDIGSAIGIGGEFGKSGVNWSFGGEFGFTYWGKNGIYLSTMASVGYGTMNNEYGYGVVGGIEERIGYSFEVKKYTTITPYLVIGTGLGYTGYSETYGSQSMSFSQFSVNARQGIGALFAQHRGYHGGYNGFYVELCVTEDFAQTTSSFPNSPSVTTNMSYTGIGLIGTFGVQLGF